MLCRKLIISQLKDCSKHMHVHMYRTYESLRRTLIAESDPAAHGHCQQQPLIKRNDTVFLTNLGKAPPQSTWCRQRLHPLWATATPAVGKIPTTAHQNLQFATVRVNWSIMTWTATRVRTYGMHASDPWEYLLKMCRNLKGIVSWIISLAVKNWHIHRRNISTCWRRVSNWVWSWVGSQTGTL